MLFDSVDTAGNALDAHLDAVHANGKTGLWVAGLDQQGSLGDAGQADTLVQTTGNMVGVDFKLGADGFAGYAMGVSRGFGQISGAFDHGQNRSTSVLMYAGWSHGPLYAGGTVGGGWFRQDMARLLMLGRVAAPVAGGFDGNFSLASGEAGARLDWRGTTVIPFAGLRYESMVAGAFAEQGAGGFGLKAGSRNTGRWQTALGLRATRGWRLAGGMRVRLDGSATWRHTVSQYGAAFEASFTGFDDWMPLSAVGLSRDYATVQMGVGVWPAQNLEIHLGLIGQHGQRQQTEAAMLQGTWQF
jgi:outer membrane autotransporter protein